jgi:hypothetical protein
MAARCARRRRQGPQRRAGPGSASRWWPRPRRTRCASRRRGGEPAAETVVSSNVNASDAHRTARNVSFARGGTSSCRSVNTPLAQARLSAPPQPGPATPAVPAPRSKQRHRRPFGGVRGQPRSPGTPGSRRPRRRTPPSARTGPAGGLRSANAPPLWLRRNRLRHRGAPPAHLAVGVAADHAGGHGAPVRVRRLRSLWRQDTSRAAEPNAKLSRAAVRWALEALVVQHLTVARVAQAFAVGHRQRPRPGRRTSGPDRRPGPVRRSDCPVLARGSPRETHASVQEHRRL